jgi:hypothetical protein
MPELGRVGDGPAAAEAAGGIRRISGAYTVRRPLMKLRRKTTTAITSRM